MYTWPTEGIGASRSLRPILYRRSPHKVRLILPLLLHLVALLEERCRRLVVELEQYQTLRKLVATHQVPRLFLIESEYRMTLREAELNWTRALIADITSGSLEGMDQWLKHHEVPLGARN